MNGVLFDEARRADVLSPNRGDVGCFMGCVDRRSTPLPSSLREWLRDNGWGGDGSSVATPDETLLHTPVPLDNFESFDQLFQWENRSGTGLTTWLGAAVRSFFSQGGSRCYVVRTGNSWDPDLSNPAKTGGKTATTQALSDLIPGYTADRWNPAEAPDTWRGLETLHGLAEVSFVCLPDLPELVADAQWTPVGLKPLPPGPEEFVEVSRMPTKPAAGSLGRGPSRSPACTAAGYSTWFRVVNAAAQFISRRRRDIHLLLAVPLPAEGSLAEGNLVNALAASLPEGLACAVNEGRTGISTAFVQLAYPWVETDGSSSLPGKVEPPDGTLAGVLARTVAVAGVHRSLGRQPLRLISRFRPALTPRDYGNPALREGVGALIDRVSLLGDTPSGPRVLSDVTTSLRTDHRPASVGRLTAAILRTARRLGDEVVFDASGPDLWRRIERRLDGLLTQFYQAGALAGESPDDAFTVQCDRTTTTQNDMDNGRATAVVKFAPAHPVGAITVVLSLRDGVALTSETPD